MLDFSLEGYIAGAFSVVPDLKQFPNPWNATAELNLLVEKLLAELSENEYSIENKVAIHHTATVESNVTFKDACIVGANCFIGAHAYLRGGIFLEKDVHVGPSSEIKSSIIFSGTSIAHMNYVGNSLIGHSVNMEAGSVIANHFNERTEKTISVKINGNIISTGVQKFGALVGDDCKIGANAVTTPGTILNKGSIVRRLELVNQVTT